MSSVRKLVVAAWAAVLCAVLLAQTYTRAERPDGIDLTSYLLSARALLHGASPYLLHTPFPYLYPATLALLLIPLTVVPSIVSVVAWFALSAVAVVWSIHTVMLAAREDHEMQVDDVALFLAAFFTFFFTVVQSNLRNGQVNFVVLALCLAAAIQSRTPRGWEQRNHTEDQGNGDSPTRQAAPATMPSRGHGNPRRGISVSSRRGWGRGATVKKLAPKSAVLWSLAVAMKLVPLALFPFFALRRRWSWLVASMLLIIIWCLLPAMVVGRRIVDIYEQYWRVFLASSFAPRVQPLDFSLAGTIAWATRAPLTPMLKISAAAGVVGWIIQADARRMRSEIARPSALYLLAIPLVSPQSEVHHLAFMLPAATIAAGALWWDGRRANRSLQISTAIAAGLYLMATAIAIAAGPLFCASLVAFVVALMNVSPPGRPSTGSGRPRACEGRP